MNSSCPCKNSCILLAQFNCTYILRAQKKISSSLTAKIPLLHRKRKKKLLWLWILAERLQRKYLASLFLYTQYAWNWIFSWRQCHENSKDGPCMECDELVFSKSFWNNLNKQKIWMLLLKVFSAKQAGSFQKIMW